MLTACEILFFHTLGLKNWLQFVRHEEGKEYSSLGRKLETSEGCNW